MITVVSVLIKMSYVKLKVVFTNLIVLNVMIFTSVRLCSPFYLRYAQNLGDMRHLQRQHSWSEHVKIYRNRTVPKTNIEILICERKLTKRKILEAMYIDTPKPQLILNIKFMMLI